MTKLHAEHTERLKISAHMPLSTQFHLLQGRLSGLEDADMTPSKVRDLRAETIERIKEVRVEMQREQQLELSLPCRDQYRP